jgi:probable selenate reductase FAD-binding subunit
MSGMEYYRPKTLSEALELLGRGVPLAGGTIITPQRRKISAVIDLRELGLDRLEIQDGSISLGAGLNLQALVEAGETIPHALKVSCHQEAGWNLRNVATIGGTIMSGDGRSPFLTVLLALEATALLEPGGETVQLGKLLEMREEPDFKRLITTIMFPSPIDLAYEQVSRSPADQPLVCAAGALLPEDNNRGRLRLALGGFGSKPIRLMEAESFVNQTGDIDAAVDISRAAYSNADDVWASGEYRSHVAGVLVRRLATRLVD